MRRGWREVGFRLPDPAKGPATHPRLHASLTLVNYKVCVPGPISFGALCLRTGGSIPHGGRNARDICRQGQRRAEPGDRPWDGSRDLPINREALQR
jgi:hypothetical protein